MKDSGYTIAPVVEDGAHRWKLTRWRAAGGIAIPTIAMGTFPSILDAEEAIKHLRSPSHNYPDEVKAP